MQRQNRGNLAHRMQRHFGKTTPTSDSDTTYLWDTRPSLTRIPRTYEILYTTISDSVTTYIPMRYTTISDSDTTYLWLWDTRPSLTRIPRIFLWDTRPSLTRIPRTYEIHDHPGYQQVGFVSLNTYKYKLLKVSNSQNIFFYLSKSKGENC